MSTDPSPIQQISHHLRRLHRRFVLVEFVRSGLWSGTALLGLGWLAILSEALLYLPPAWRWVPPGLALLATFATAILLSRRGIGAVPDEHAMALRAEARAPALRQRLITAMELTEGSNCSAALLAATRMEALTTLEAIPIQQIVPPSRPRMAARSIGGMVLLSIILVTLTGETVAGVGHRWLHPTRTFTAPQRTHVAFDLTAATYIAGDDVDIRLDVSGEIPQTATLWRRHAGEETWLSEELLIEPSPASDTTASAAGALARYVWRDVRQSFELRARAGDGSTLVRRVQVIAPPVVTGLRLEYDYPDYSGLPRRIEEEGGDIRALAGTRIQFTVASSKTLKSANLILDDSLSIDAEVMGRSAAVAWTLPGRADSVAARRYHLRLIDVNDVENRNPIHYAIETLDDGAPSVEITVPGHDSDLPDSQQLTLGVEAADDFGLTRVDLVYRINDGPDLRSPLSTAHVRQASLHIPWDLTAHNLLPEDRIHYFVEAFDNDLISGPKKAVSLAYTLRFPSLYELFDEVSSDQEERLDTLEELASEEEAARDVVEGLRREVLKSEDLSWQEKKELDAALAAEAARAEAVQELAREMSETMDQLEQSGLGSEQLLDKLEQIRELMAAVTSPEMQEALQELQQVTQGELNPQKLAEALRKFAEDQEAFQERLDRTISLLRQVHAEQRLMAATQKAEDLATRQEQINDALEKTSPDNDSQRLADQEARLAADTDRLQDELADLGEQMQDLHQPTAEGLQAQSDMMEAGQLTQRMKSLEQQLEAGTSQQAQRHGEGLEEDLGRLSAAMQKLQAEFSAGQREDLASALREVAHDALDLSLRQEHLQRTIDTLGAADAMLRAPEQFALGAAVRRLINALAKVARQTMTVHPGLPATLGYALQQTEAAAGHLSQQERQRAIDLQGEATTRLNEAVRMLRESASDVSQAQMPSGFAEAMEKMMGLSQQQAALNEATQQALQQQGRQQGEGGRGSMDEMMARLAAEQRRIQQALSEMERSLRGQRSLQERVGEIQREMDDVLRQLEQGRPHSSVPQRQQRILQRMLDASRSIHSRGFEKKRRSEVATQRRDKGPAGLPDGLGQRPDRWRQAMSAAMTGDYPAGYRRLVQQYYEAVYLDLSATPEEVE